MSDEVRMFELERKVKELEKKIAKLEEVTKGLQAAKAEEKPQVPSSQTPGASWGSDPKIDL
jgi:hypothetical protein